MENQFKTSIVAHLTRLRNFYKIESDYYEKQMKENPRLKQPKENYLKYHWEYRAYDMLLTNIQSGNYDSAEYYNKYLKPLPSNK
jgi:hypothetical protein